MKNYYLVTLPFFAISIASGSELLPERRDITVSSFTESPITVEPGIWQVEATLWELSRAGGGSTWALGESIITTGLTTATDLQLVLRPWIHEEGGAEGFGDGDLRLKWNLWGNDGGKTAGALMPFVTVPTHTAVSSGEWQGGLIFPVSVEISDRVGLGLQVEIDRIWDEDARAHQWDFLHSAAIGCALTETVGVFLEYVGVAGERDYEASLIGGLTWATSENVVWDFAIGGGLTRAADDLALIQGVTFRF